MVYATSFCIVLRYINGVNAAQDRSANLLPAWGIMGFSMSMAVFERYVQPIR